MIASKLIQSVSSLIANPIAVKMIIHAAINWMTNAIGLRQCKPISCLRAATESEFLPPSNAAGKG
jgi:hypothetical protein